MESYEVLKQSLDDVGIKMAAHRLGLSQSMVYKWCQPGLGDLAPLIQFGASPRATIALTLAAKAWALIQGRAYVTPGDIKAIGPDVLRHRIILTYEAEAQGMTTDAVVKRIFDNIPVP